MDLVERIPRELERIFGPVSDEAARVCGFIKRERGFSGSDFVRTLVFEWLARPRATLEQLASALGITASGLQQRWSKEAGDCLCVVLRQALELMFASRPARIPLLARFNGVYVEDCTVISLPATLAEQFRGCRGSDEESGKAALRVFVSYELKTGKLEELAIAEARGPDSVVAQAHAPALPAGALRIRDLGFFDRRLLEADASAGVHWISRIPPRITLQTRQDGPSIPITAFLANQGANVDRVDTWLWIGQADGQAQPLRCRLLAVRCPPEVAARRRQKVHESARRKGRTASQQRLQMCDWTVLITSVPEEMLSIAEAWELYCARWQVELLFKRWKGLGGIQMSPSLKAERVLCELYAKLLGMLVAHWFTLIRGGPLEGYSVMKAIREIQHLAGRIADALRCPQALARIMGEIVALMRRFPKSRPRRKCPSTRQRLFHSRLKA